MKIDSEDSYPEPQTTWDQAERAAADGDHREVVLLLRRLHGMGQWRVTAQIGVIYELGGHGVAIQIDEALNWYRKAVFESDDPIAHLGLGRIYFGSDTGTHRNPGLAREHLLKAFQKGKPEAGIYLGLMYLYGYGVEASVPTAEEYFAAAAAADFPLAYHYLAAAAFVQRKYLEGARHTFRELQMRFKLWRQDREHPNLWKP